MDIGSLVETHGYWLLALGCLLEGETALVLAGVAAHKRLLDPGAVFAVAAAAAIAGDQATFWLGRWQGRRLLARWPRLHAKADRVHALLARWHAPLIIGLRFAYGLRSAGLVFLGTSPLPAWRFTLYNTVGALLWAAAVGSLGWVFGAAAQALLGELQRQQWVVLGALGAAAVLCWGWWRWRRKP